MITNDYQPQPTTLTVDQTARTLGLSRSTIFKLINSGELPSFVMAGRRLVKYAEVLKLVEAHEAKRDDRADFRAKRARRGFEVRAKRRNSPTGVSMKKAECQEASSIPSCT